MEDKVKCKHNEDVDWDKKPTPNVDGDNIYWHGTCETCGKRVYQIYIHDPTIYEE